MRTRRYVEDDDEAPSRSLLARLRKLELAESHAIHCGLCRYHRGENRTWHSPHADVRKRRRRRRQE